MVGCLQRRSIPQASDFGVWCWTSVMTAFACQPSLCPFRGLRGARVVPTRVVTVQCGPLLGRLRGAGSAVFDSFRRRSAS